MPGVKGVVKVDGTSVAVVADTWWRAKTALEALPVQWNEGPGAEVSSAQIAEHLKGGLDAKEAYALRNDGDALKAIGASAKTIEAVYSTPFLAHATMEPMNCTAVVYPDRAEAWVPTQNAEASLAALSEESGLPLAKCEINRTDLGCGFGRRGGNQDYTRQATSIAKQFPGTPVKLIWTREEDIQHDFYRPISQAKMTAGLDADGNITGMHIRIAGQSINAWVNPGSIADGKDKRQLQGLWEEPGDAQLGYTFPNLLMEYAMRNTYVPVGPWRGVNTNQNGVYMECFMDELARAAGKDPLEFRRAVMAKHPKHLRVLDIVAEKAGWGTPLPPGVHRGIAQFMGYYSYSAAVAEVSVSPKGELTIHRHGPRARLRPRGEPAHDRGAGRGLGGAGPVGDALRRDHDRPWPRGAVEFPRLPGRAPRADAEGRDRARSVDGLLGRRGRAHDLRRRALGAERDPRSHGQARARAAAEEREARLGRLFEDRAVFAQRVADAIHGPVELLALDDEGRCESRDGAVRVLAEHPVLEQRLDELPGRGALRVDLQADQQALAAHVRHHRARIAFRRFRR